MSCRYEADQGYVRGDGVDCFERHCLSCGANHVDQRTCPWCVGEAREVLREIGELVDCLPEEAEAKGVRSEAMNLLGPACDPEARGHLAASVAAGRVPAHYLDEADDEQHPLIVLGATQMEWEDALDHESLSRVTVSGALHYLGANLTYVAQLEHNDFAEQVTAWRRSLGHLRSVLGTGEQRRTGAPCPTCDPVRVLHATEDGWRCNGCWRQWDEVQYQELVRAGYLVNAEWLSGPDCAEATGAPRSSITGWASKGLVDKKVTEGRVHYRVAQVRQLAEKGGQLRARDTCATL